MYFRGVLLFAFFASLAVAQTQTPAPDVPSDVLEHQRHDDDNEPPPASATSVPPDSPVITIEGICDGSADATPSVSPSAAATTGACKTIVTKAQFEKLVEALNPQMPGPARRQLAQSYPRLLVFANKARELGLDQDPGFAEVVRFTSMQVLTQELTRYFEEQAGKISDSEIEAYYKANVIKFEREELLRILIPKQKRQEKTVSGERSGSADSSMLALAEKIRARAAAGGDFQQLQKEAFEAAGISSGSPNVSTGKIAAVRLPLEHQRVFEMEPGQVSGIVPDPSGYYIYKVVSKEKVPLAQVSKEIRKSIASERVQDATASLGRSIKSEFDEKYFGATSRTRHASDQSAAKPGIVPAPK
jgi:parvulin-like peptidyl-prolyl isomerase